MDGVQRRRLHTSITTSIPIHVPLLILYDDLYERTRGIRIFTVRGERGRPRARTLYTVVYYYNCNTADDDDDVIRYFILLHGAAARFSVYYRSRASGLIY